MSDSESEENYQDVISNVDLGFLEKSPHWKLESRFFPSKIGYKPAWLVLSDDIPNISNLRCSTCDKPKTFLCQLYAPIGDMKEYCFHRTIYVFVCKTDGCVKSNSNSGFKVFRSQLPRVNKYYPYDPPVEEEAWKPDLCAKLFGVKLCNFCGIGSTNHCGGCKVVYYCCKEHQILDWKSGHKFVCKEGDKNTLNNSKTILFPEFEVVIEHESDIIEENKESIVNNDSSFLKNKGTLQGVPCDEELEKMAFSEEDKNFIKFREQTKYAPDQVIRYDREGLPLWISEKNIPSRDKSVPNCQYCDGERVFEFQILPQLLNYLELNNTENSLDWGTLAIFTCKNNCNNGPDYKEEYLLKQDFN